MKIFSKCDYLWKKWWSGIKIHLLKILKWESVSNWGQKTCYTHTTLTIDLTCVLNDCFWLLYPKRAPISVFVQQFWCHFHHILRRYHFKKIFSNKLIYIVPVVRNVSFKCFQLILDHTVQRPCHPFNCGVICYNVFYILISIFSRPGASEWREFGL